MVPSMDMVWKPLFPLILVSALIVHEEWLSSPSCRTLTPFSNLNKSIAEDEEEEELKVMLVANLLLLGSESGFVTRILRDHYTSKFFTKSFQKLEPDMVVVLGDVSARGSEMTRSKWLAVVRQFHGLLGPSLGIPFHVVLGDRDVGRCGELDAGSVDWIAGRFPGLDAAGCGAFEISNVSFVSLNSVALLCGGNNELRFGVEKVVERESLEVAAAAAGPEIGRWRGTRASPGSGPVVLLHFPLHHQTRIVVEEDDSGGDGRGYVGGADGDEPYKLTHSLPPNVTEYIFQALKPRIVFSGHSRDFSAYVHPDGTYEVAVPAMTWNAKDDPAFIVAVFRRNTKAVSIIYCALPRESRVISAYISLLVLLASLFVLIKMHQWLVSRRLWNLFLR